MNITSIGSFGTEYINKVAENAQKAATSSQGTATFDSIYNAVSGLVKNTNSYIQQAQQAEVDFALGNITSTHELAVYQQQANIALQYTVAVRDKVLEAYKELMNMSI